MYGTDLHVELNPVLVEDLIEAIEETDESANIVQPENENIVQPESNEAEEPVEEESETETETENIVQPESEESDMETIIEEKEEAVESIIDAIVGGDEEDGDTESTEVNMESENSE